MKLEDGEVALLFSLFHQKNPYLPPQKKAIFAFTFGIITDSYGIGISFLIISMVLTLSTILINSYKNHRHKRANNFKSINAYFPLLIKSVGITLSIPLF